RIEEYLLDARRVEKHQSLSEEERQDFFLAIERLKNKLDDYEGEPTLYTFECLERDLQKELSRYENEEFTQNLLGRKRDHRAGLDDGSSWAQEHQQLEVFVAKAHQLGQIADRMLTQSIQTSCLARAKGMIRYTQYLLAGREAPRAFIQTEAQLQDLLNRLKSGETITQEEFTRMRQVVDALKVQPLDRDTSVILAQIKSLYNRVEVMMQGGKDSDASWLFEGETLHLDWAWRMFDLSRNATFDEVKRAYRKAAQVHHPDKNSSPDASERMKNINAAYELLKALLVSNT
ncbi:MAG: DnaJ domain-containing protein, partial [Candidatus Kaiserbacteria bacterium]|nr:DnaJ domain-containing protein [Candidatus Kaiserbacteria bacterium]